MKVIGPLMHEHRLIERMVALMKKEIQSIESGNRPDMEFLRHAVEFIQTYADRCHHGKEEDILFRELKKKDLKDEHDRMVNLLIEEHKYGRRMTARLTSGLNDYVAGDERGKDALLDAVRRLVTFYPEHIRKEDQEFFHPILEYFDDQENTAMLKEYEEVERRALHNRYTDLVETYEGDRG